MSEVSRYMSRPVKSIEFDASVQKAAEKMKTKKVGALAVLKKGDYVGIITDTDMTRKIAAQSLASKSVLVESIMTSPPITIDESASLEEANRLMKKKGIRHIIVTKRGKVTGLISVRDLTPYIYNFFRMSEQVLPEKRGYVCLPLSAGISFVDEKKKRYKGITYDISAGGLFVQTNSPLPKGSKITMKFALPKEPESIKSKGIISWLRSHPEELSRSAETEAKAEVTYVREKMRRQVFHSGMGIRFTDINEEDRIKIMNFIMKWVEEAGAK